MRGRLLISLAVSYEGVGQLPGPLAALAGQTDTAGPPMAHGLMFTDDAGRVAGRAMSAKVVPVEGFRLTDSFLAARNAEEPPGVCRFDLSGEFPTREQAVEAAHRMVGALPRSGDGRQFADLLWGGDGDEYDERIEL